MLPEYKLSAQSMLPFGYVSGEHGDMTCLLLLHKCPSEACQPTQLPTYLAVDSTVATCSYQSTQSCIPRMNEPPKSNTWGRKPIPKKGVSQMNRTDSKENRDNPETDKNFRRILHIIFQDVRKDNYTQKTR